MSSSGLNWAAAAEEQERLLNKVRILFNILNFFYKSFYENSDFIAKMLMSSVSKCR